MPTTSKSPLHGHIPSPAHARAYYPHATSPDVSPHTPNTPHAQAIHIHAHHPLPPRHPNTSPTQYQQPASARKSTDDEDELELYDQQQAAKYGVSNPYHSLAAFSVFINFVIGTGVFGLPDAFVKAGPVLSIACLLGFAAVSIQCMMYTLESMARVEGILKWTERNKRRLQAGERSPLLGGSLEQRVGVSHTSNYGSSSSRHEHELSPLSSTPSMQLRMTNKPVHTLTYRKIDFATISQLVGGYPLTAFTQICLILYCLGVLWAYAAVFASSVNTLFFQYVLNEQCNIYLANQTVGCYTGYYVCVAIFSAVVIVLSLMDISDQARIQQVMTGYRFTAFTTMIITVLIASFYPNQFDPAHSSNTPPHFVTNISPINWNGFGMIFSVAGVALNVHYNIPDIVQPMQTKAKKNILRVCMIGMGTTILFYILIGWICAAEFGSMTFPLVTLNWSGYTGIDGGWGVGQSTAAWSAIIKLFIMLFPVLNMISVFPLVAISLADNLITSVPQSIKSSFTPSQIRTLCRLLSVLPPLLFSVLAGKLDLIFNITGLIAFFLELVIPCIFQLLSIRYCVRQWGSGSEKTPYSLPLLSSQMFTSFILLLSFASFFYATYITIQQIVVGDVGGTVEASPTI